ncbi:hypothetical protein [Paenibacillus pseudetheri]|uniref:Uncharacterized protein n=1 Tax=Paenibacillus pseudetheri TaxID=2897682 RepID=A0ABM9BCP7_9BACL|nr:hypothetical protein [Paenibacillus pseudetheri]CAH1056431.1 hypothetical protein PAECIP111894_02584 [Paenibacillus pseudetheri]
MFEGRGVRSALLLLRQCVVDVGCGDCCSSVGVTEGWERLLGGSDHSMDAKARRALLLSGFDRSVGVTASRINN